MHLVHQPTAWLYRQYSTEYSTDSTVQYSTVQVMFDLQKIAWCVALASPLLPTWQNDRQRNAVKQLWHMSCLLVTQSGLAGKAAAAARLVDARGAKAT